MRVSGDAARWSQDPLSDATAFCDVCLVQELNRNGGEPALAYKEPFIG